MFTADIGGQGTWRLARSLATLADEIAEVYPTAVCLGTIGNAAHEAEGDTSDHNPFVQSAGYGVVRAMDIGGPESIQQALFDHIQMMYQGHDSRVWPFGYVHKDNLITSWPGPGVHIDYGDVGHLHVSVTQVDGNNPSAAGYVPAIDSTASWDLANTTQGTASDMSYRLIHAPAPSLAIYAYSPFGGMALLPEPGFLAVAFSDPDCVTKSSGAIELCDQDHWDYYTALSKSAGTA
jgi:hypothetical protein